MATITGLTAARMLAIEAASVISGVVTGDNLILSKFDGSTINAGNVRGPQGIQGPSGAASSVLTASDILDLGISGQKRAGRVLTVADFTNLGLQAPAVLYNLTDLTDVSGNIRTLTNKGAVTFGRGITGATPEAAIFTGSTTQVLYRTDEAALSIAYGSWGCWLRTAKRSTGQMVLSKYTATGSQKSFYLDISNNIVDAAISTTGGNEPYVAGITDIADDRWHFVVATYDGSFIRLYIDGVLEVSSTAASGPIFDGTAPLNIGGSSGDAATATTSPFFGQVDEAFVTSDVLSADQVRLLYSQKIAHGLTAVPSQFGLMVNRRRRGAPLIVGDFPATPDRLYNFTAGSLVDAGSDIANLVNNGGAIAGLGADGKSGDGFNFDGVDDYLSATDTGLPAGTTARSMGCWFKETVASAGLMGLISYGTGPSNKIAIAINSAFKLIVYDGTSPVFSDQLVNDGVWHFVVAVLDVAAIDGLKSKLYLDGRLTASSITAAASTTLLGVNGFTIGSDGANYYKGNIDGAFVYTGALTPDEILKLYAKGGQVLGLSPKNAGDHIERVDATNIYTIFDTLESQHQIDLKVMS